jgi:hypothetical protein
MHFSIEPLSSSKTDEDKRIAQTDPIVAGDIGSTLHNASTGAEGEIISQPIAKMKYAKLGLPPEKNAIVGYASRISDNNLDFIATLDKENAGTWEVGVMNWNKNGTYDKGICQFNSQYFLHYINDPRFTDPYWQVDMCWKSYSEWAAKGIVGQRFYAYNHRHLSKPNFYLTEIDYEKI